MSPLHIEAFNPARKEWVLVGKIRPTDPSGSMSDNKPDGKRDIYMFECAEDDSKSTIYRSGSGIDTEVGMLRASVIDPSKLEVIKELKKGESFEMDIRTDRSPVGRKVRLTHR